MTKCEVCGSTSWLVTKIEDIWIYGKCKNCGHRQIVRRAGRGEFEVTKSIRG